MAIDGFRINLGAAGRKIDLSTLVKEEHFEKLLQDAKADPRYRELADQYEFRLRRIGNEAVLELKQQNLGSKFTFFGGARRSEERKKAVEAFTRLYPDLPLNLEGEAIRRREARSLRNLIIQRLDNKPVEPNIILSHVERASNRVGQQADPMIQDAQVQEQAIQNPIAQNDARASRASVGEPVRHEIRGAIKTTAQVEELLNLIPVGPPEQRSAFLLANSDLVNALIQYARLNRAEVDNPVLIECIDSVAHDYFVNPRLAAVRDYVRDEICYGDDIAYHFLVSDEGTIAAIDANSYDKAVNLDPSAKCAENTILFIDHAKEQGGVSVGKLGLKYFVVGHDKEIGLRLLNQFSVLTDSMSAKPPLAQDISSKVFGDDPVVMHWFTRAFQGTAEKLTLDEGVILAGQFDQNAQYVISGGDWHFFANDRNRWDQARLAESHLAMLKAQAARVGVAPNDSRAIAHFLFGMSATFTRMSSDQVFGNDGASIPSLRFYGYTLFKEAQRQSPDLLTANMWLDMENRFLNRNNAFDCAAILSGMQFGESKAINADEFGRFVPKIFQPVASEPIPIQIAGLEDIDDDEVMDIDDISRIQEERARAQSAIEI